MTSVAARVVRRLGLAVLVLACLSPAPWRIPDLPPIPAMIGLVPEPVVTPAPRPVAAPVFTAIDTPASAPAQFVQPARRKVSRAAPKAPPPPPPRSRPQRRPSKNTGARGEPLPTLPPDEVPRGRYHRVEEGDTAASIAAAYGLKSQWAVYDANPIVVDPDAPPVGVWLYIPHPTMTPQPRPRPGQPGYSPTPSPTVIVDGIWLQLAECESSGRWNIDTGNGYYGGLQFTLSSWRAVGGAGYPHQAHPMEQIARADYLQRIQGWGAWPTCAGKLGLIPQAEADAIVENARARQRREGGPTVEEGRSTEPPDNRSER